MFRNQGERESIKPARGFFSTLVAGVSAIVVVGVICTAGIGFYGLNIADRKSDNLMQFARNLVGDMPELIAALPPIVGDVLSDERRPEYADHIQVTATMPEFGSGRRGRCPIIEVRNTGPEVVSMLSMRVVVLNEHGNPIADFNEWAASPIAGDRDWRGPLLPDAKRVFSADSFWIATKSERSNLSVDVEITDVRVWKPTRKAANVNVRNDRDDSTAPVTLAME